MTSKVRIPNEGEPIAYRPPTHRTSVFIAYREVRRRLMGSREGARFEAELRELVGDAYVTVGRVKHATRDGALAAARKLAAKRKWTVIEKRLGWATRDASTERMIAEDAAAVLGPGPKPIRKPRVLTEADWQKVFEARCKSKAGRADTITPDERRVLEIAFETDPKRYSALDRDVFNTTAAGIGSMARRK